MSLLKQAREIAQAYGYTLTAQDTIQSPGKFEGEHILTLYFWDSLMEGMADAESDANNEHLGLFSLDYDESLELDGAQTFVLLVRDSGFVSGYASPRPIEELIAEHFPDEPSEFNSGC